MGLIEVVPQSATHKGMPVTLLYLQERGDASVSAWIFDDDGVMKRVELTELVVDFRYDARIGKWISVAPGTVEEETHDTTTFG